jgi:hypothetical protein
MMYAKQPLIDRRGATCGVAIVAFDERSMIPMFVGSFDWQPTPDEVEETVKAFEERWALGGKMAEVDWEPGVDRP